MSDRWGVFDTKDNCWLGDASGPKLFTDVGLKGRALSDGETPAVTGRVLAQISCQMTAVQLDWPQTRLRPMPYSDEPLIEKDEIDLTMPALKALRLIEGGKV